MMSIHEKHVDLQMHTVCSTMDGLMEVRELFIAASVEQWPAVVITDTNTVQAFPEIKRNARRYGIKPIYGAQLLCRYEDYFDVYPITVLVRNQAGIKSLYTLISMSNTKNGHLPLSEVLKHREGLLLGSGGAYGLLTTTFLNDPDKAEAMVKAFDFLEIQPLAYYQYKWKDHFTDRQSIEAHIRMVADMGKQFRIPLTATSGARYLSEETETAYKALQYSAGAEDDVPSHHYRCTQDMVEEFAFLGDEEARQVVLENPSRIAGQVENNITPIPENSHFITFENAETEIRTAAYKKAAEIYGDSLPIQISERLSWELDAIAKSGSASMFVLCQRIAEKAKTLNYEVIQRGCTAASFVAYLLGMTNINPLPAYYHCTCHYCEFPGLQYYTGYDLPEKRCPVCGKLLTRCGMNLVPETLFGLNGEKKPYIEINIACEYKDTVRKQLTDIFGMNCVFRASGWECVGTDAAAEMLERYLEKHSISMNEEEHSKLTDCIAGAKQNDTLHPGTFIFIPAEKEITDFSPVVTLDDDPATQFDAYKLDTILTKINILDYSNLSILHAQSIAAGVQSVKISNDSLPITDIISSGETMCLPCFEDDRAQAILKELKITGVSELLKVFGFAHGTGAWEAYKDYCSSISGKELIECVAFRDDIFNDLIMHGIDRQKAFEIMELVRCGRFYQGSDGYNYPNRDKKQTEMETLLKTAGFSEKYICALKKIRYLFPKAHAAVILDIVMKIIQLKNHNFRNNPLNKNTVY